MADLALKLIKSSKLVKNVSSLFLMQVANYVLPMVSLPIMVRIIGPENFGSINYAAALVSYFVLLINYGFNLSATRLIAREPANQEHVSKVFSEVLACKIILLTLSTAIFTALLHFFLGNADSRLMWYSFFICFPWVFTLDWLYQGQQKLSVLAWVNFFSKLLATAAILVVIRQKEDYYWQPLLLFIAQMATAIGSFWYGIVKFNIRVYRPSWKEIKHILLRDRMLFLSSLVISLFNTTNVVILGLVSTRLEVGYYSAAQRFIAIGLSLISMPFSQSIFPYISNAFGKSTEEGFQAVRRIAPVVIWVSLFGSLGLFLTGSWVIRLFYGPSFGPSAWMYLVMAWIPFLVSISNLIGVQVMLNLHLDRLFFRFTVLSSLFSILLSVFLSHRFGGIGTSFASLSTEIFVVVVMLIWLKRNRYTVFDPKAFHPRVLLNRFLRKENTP